ncbi:AMP-binding protein [Aureliella helgolandensis]|uniref:AMP-binding protein n=1 Tax=Aureliella helgolandensis TaxID=2527968 RepID=UPI0018D155F0|nr:AMP-binding protein [Aureliella helgolandensis]
MSTAVEFLPNSVATLFWQRVLLEGPHSCFVHFENNALRESDWLEAGERVGRLCRWLIRQGAKTGDHVASWLPNSYNWICLDLACQTLGVVHVAIDARERPARVQHLVEFCNAHLLVTSELLSELDSHDSASRATNDTRVAIASGADTVHQEARDWERAARAVPAGHAAQMLFTSGSVSQPKGVLLSHESLVTNAAAKLDAAPQCPTDVRLNILPFTHAYARTCELSTWILSGCVLAIADNWIDFVAKAARLQPSLVNLVPHLARKLAGLLEQDPRALGQNLRLLQVGGAPLTPELWYRLDSLGLPPVQGYGLTEAGPVVCSNRVGQQRPGTIGPPVRGVEIRVDAENILCVRGPNIMLGYWNAANQTATAIRDGWLVTGDLAEIDSDGYVRIVGRVSNQIVLTTGYKVNPEELEQKLLHDERLEQVLIVGEGRAELGVLVQLSRVGERLLDAELPAHERPSPGRSAMPGTQPGSRVLRSSDRDVQRERLGEEILSRMSLLLSELPQHMHPRRIAFFPVPPSAEQGTTTLKGTLCRQVALARYRECIDNLFASVR